MTNRENNMYTNDDIVNIPIHHNTHEVGMSHT